MGRTKSIQQMLLPSDTQQSEGALGRLGLLKEAADVEDAEGTHLLPLLLHMKLVIHARLFC